MLSPYFSRIEQTATVRVDNGPIVTGASPGKLRQLNGNGHVYVGMYLLFCLLHTSKQLSCKTQPEIIDFGTKTQMDFFLFNREFSQESLMR